MKINNIILGLLLLVVSQTGFSQHDSLRKYMQIAIENNPAVQQKFSEYRAAVQKIPQAGALPDPEFNISYFLMPMELVGGRQIAEMNLMQMFPWFGVLKNAKDEMTNMAYAEFEEYRETGLEVGLDVQNTWYDLYRVRKTIEITRKNMEILETIEDITLTRYKSAGLSVNTPTPPTQNQPSSGAVNQSGSSSQGMNAMSSGQSGSSNAQTARQSMPMNNNQMEQSSGSGLADLYRLKMESADLENTLLDLDDQEKVLSERLNIIMNRAKDTFIFIPDSLLIFTLPQDSLINAGSDEGNPMLEMIEYEKKAYEAREKMTRSMGLPMVGLGVGYSILGQNELITEMDEPMGGKDMVMPMLSVSIPIWRKKYRAMRKEAEILSESTNQRYESASNNLRLEQNEALKNYRDALRRKELYSRQKALASNTLELLQTRLSVSSASLTDILRVQQQLFDYEAREVEAVTDLNKSMATLNRIMALSINDLNLKNKELK